MVPHTLKRLAAVSLAAALALSLAACGKGGSSSSDSTDASGTATLKLWTHAPATRPSWRDPNQIVADLQRQPGQVQGRGAGLPAGFLQPSVTAAASSNSSAVHPGHRRPERAELGVGRVSRPAWTGWTTRCPSSCPARSAPTTARTTRLGSSTSRWRCMRGNRCWSRTTSVSRPSISRGPGMNSMRRWPLEGAPGSANTRWTCRPAMPVSGGPTPTPRCCRASVVT